MNSYPLCVRAFVAVATILFVGCQTVVPTASVERTSQQQLRLDAERQAIRAVLTQDAAIVPAIEKDLTLLERYWNSAPVFIKIANQMDRIDISACPSTFQLAYKRYADAYRLCGVVKGNWEGWNGFLRYIATSPSNWGNGLTDYDRALKGRMAALDDLRRMAVEHGVSL